jgi:hypothetical protein
LKEKKVKKLGGEGKRGRDKRPRSDSNKIEGETNER